MLALEVLWTRMLALVLENSVYTFAAILVVVLLCLAGGSLLSSLLARRKWSPHVVLAALLGLSGFSIALTPSLAGVPGQQAANLLAVRRLAQPDQPFLLQLPHSLPAETYHLAHLRQRLPRLSAQLVAYLDHPAQPTRQTTHHLLQTGPHLLFGHPLLRSRFPVPEEHAPLPEGMRSLIGLAMILDRCPDLVHNCRVGIGRKLVAPLWIKARNGSPQPDPSGLDRFLFGRSPRFWRLTA